MDTMESTHTSSSGAQVQRYYTPGTAQPSGGRSGQTCSPPCISVTSRLAGAVVVVIHKHKALREPARPAGQHPRCRRHASQQADRAQQQRCTRHGGRRWRPRSSSRRLQCCQRREPNRCSCQHCRCAVGDGRQRAERSQRGAARLAVHRVRVIAVQQHLTRQLLSRCGCGCVQVVAAARWRGQRVSYMQWA